MQQLIDKLAAQHTLTEAEFAALLDSRTPELSQYLFDKARRIRAQHFGRDVYLRGLIELTNWCRQDCYYCGIRCSNKAARRYRLTPQEVLACCAEGYALGYRTFVLQGGEDPWYTPDRVESLVRDIRTAFPDCAITLSLGEFPEEIYRRWFCAGADRYLLRHETADPEHFSLLHPPCQTLHTRMECLHSLKKIGYQVGCGFMVGSPGQTNAHLARDLAFISRFRPEMVGIGPFIPHKDTPFADKCVGNVELTVFLLALVRLMLPQVLLPATTALGTLDPAGRDKGILAGANVCMPNLSPPAVRDKYMLYNNKLSTGEESAQSRDALQARLNAIGYQAVCSRGDHPAHIKKG